MEWRAEKAVLPYDFRSGGKGRLPADRGGAQAPGQNRVTPFGKNISHSGARVVYGHPGRSPRRPWPLQVCNLRKRTGVRSIYRNGDQVQNISLCLRVTLDTASHQIGRALRAFGTSSG